MAEQERRIVYLVEAMSPGDDGPTKLGLIDTLDLVRIRNVIYDHYTEVAESQLKAHMVMQWDCELAEVEVIVSHPDLEGEEKIIITELSFFE